MYFWKNRRAFCWFCSKKKNRFGLYAVFIFFLPVKWGIITLGTNLFLLLIEIKKYLRNPPSSFWRCMSWNRNLKIYDGFQIGKLSLWSLILLIFSSSNFMRNKSHFLKISSFFIRITLFFVFFLIWNLLGQVETPLHYNLEKLLASQQGLSIFRNPNPCVFNPFF